MAGNVLTGDCFLCTSADVPRFLSTARPPLCAPPFPQTLVARTQRQVEATQSMIRIVGLSATLPNYRDVAAFLSVNLSTGLFFFDASYRPVPLETQFIGVSEPSLVGRTRVMNQVCWDKVAESLRGGYQAMVFVHSRKETGEGQLVAMTQSRNIHLCPGLSTRPITYSAHTPI